MKSIRATITALLVLTVFWISIGHAAPPLPVFVSIAPQKYFVQQIGRDRVQVMIMVQPGADPHTYEPKPRQMVALTRAKLYFTIGIEFEAVKLQKILSTQPGLTVVHTEQNIPKIPMAAHHDHGEPESEGARHHTEHSGDTASKAPSRHGIMDPHIWLSPPLVMMQAQTILNALQQADPASHSFYQDNFNEFLSDLKKLHAELNNLFSGRSGLPFMVFHPSWGYFAHAYGLKQVPIELEGKKPKPSQLQELIEYARKNRIRIIFAQPQVSSQSAQLIAREIKGEVAFIDPLAGDWMQNLREVSAKFKLTFGK